MDELQHGEVEEGISCEYQQWLSLVYHVAIVALEGLADVLEDIGPLQRSQGQLRSQELGSLLRHAFR